MRAVFTGVGVVAPNGLGVEKFWEATLSGRRAIARISRFESGGYSTRLAGEVAASFGPERVPGRLAVQTDRWTQFAFVAADEAIRMAGFDPAQLDEYEMAVVTASSSGGNEFGQREISQLWSQGPQFVGVYQSIAWFYAATTGQLSIRHGMRGPCGVFVGEQAGGLDAIGEARRVLARGARAVLTGGTEAPLSPFALTCQIGGARLSSCDDPARAYQPFGADAQGHVPGEGGAMLLMEDAGHGRSAQHPLGRLAGYASTFDPRPGSGRPPTLRRAIERALGDAGLSAADIDVVFADAAGERGSDRDEAQAIAEVFGAGAVPVTAPKSMVGRLYAGGGPLDVVCALLAIRDGVVPPTVGVAELAPNCPIDLVRDEPRAVNVRAALVVARGYGGFNSAVVITGPNDAAKEPTWTG
ncbi:MAG TPA: ketosynthase chain-length factor [Rugosimonospora sp.]|nr:ketosynthase chain-length factor [Rugosimonospora sp.]